MPDPETVNLDEVAASAGVRTGTIWTLKESDDMNANLVRFDTGQGVGNHINDEVDVLIVGVSGSGIVQVDDEEHALGAGILVFVPKGVRRSTWGITAGFAYLSIHKRRGLIRISRQQAERYSR